MRKSGYLNIPNALSLSRIAGVPVLFWLVHIGPTYWFVMLFIVLALTDWLDGKLARKWNQTSEFGSMMDTLGDVALYMSTAYFLIVLFPDYLNPNLSYLAVLLAGFFATMGVSKLILGRVLFLHTHISRTAAVILVLVFLSSFYVDTTYMLRLVIFMYITAFAEMCIIFAKFGEVDPDTRTILRLIRDRRAPRR